MTSLIYYLTDQQVCIASDTLMSRDDGSPFHFVTKIMLLPHLRGVLCGTGSGNLLLRWHFLLQESAVIPTLAWMLDHTPAHLQKLAAEIKLPSEFKTTMYHFAWNEGTGKIDGYSFSALERFAPKLAARESLVVKPGYEGVENDAEVVFAGVDGFAHIMAKQRAADDQLPPGERSRIGGEVHFVEITSEGVFQAITRRFADYNDLYKQMVEALSRGERL